jgi:hypothetical protein
MSGSLTIPFLSLVGEFLGSIRDYLVSFGVRNGLRK